MHSSGWVSLAPSSARWLYWRRAGLWRRLVSQARSYGHALGACRGLCKDGQLSGGCCQLAR
jgi:hypothetical protein